MKPLVELAHNDGLREKCLDYSSGHLVVPLDMTLSICTRK